MSQFVFTVEQEKFSFDESFLGADRFVVHSVPRDYEVSWEEKSSPA